MHCGEHGSSVSVAFVLGQHSDGLHVGGVCYRHNPAVSDNIRGVLFIGMRPLKYVIGAGGVGYFGEEHIKVPGIEGEELLFESEQMWYIVDIGAAQAGAVGERTGKFWMLKFRVHIYAPLSLRRCGIARSALALPRKHGGWNLRVRVTQVEGAGVGAKIFHAQACSSVYEVACVGVQLR